MILYLKPGVVILLIFQVITTRTERRLPTEAKPSQANFPLLLAYVALVFLTALTTWSAVHDKVWAAALAGFASGAAVIACTSLMRRSFRSRLR